MKKRCLIIFIIIAAAGAICICFIARPGALGNMSGSYTEKTTTISDISFSGETGGRIKLSFRSEIISGDLDMVLYDSSGSEVYTLDRAKALETFFTFERSDTYTLAAECNEFIGKYKIKVYLMPD